MNTIAVLLFAHLAIVQCGLRIIGGRDALANEFPFVGTLEYYDGNHELHYLCTCAALTPTRTLTAGHCLPLVLEYVVRYGTENSPPGTPNNIAKVLSYIIHPAYMLQNLYVRQRLRLRNDIALLRTDRVSLKYYARVSTLSPVNLRGQQINVVGYGLTNSSEGNRVTLEMQKPLQVVDAIVIGCDDESYNDLLKPSMCVSRRCDQSATICEGDSGGPAIHPSGIVGTNSITVKRDCSPSAGHRAFFVSRLTPVGPYVEWISSHIKDEDDI